MCPYSQSHLSFISLVIILSVADQLVHSSVFPSNRGLGVKRKSGSRRSRMMKLANAFLEDEPSEQPTQPKLWGAIARVSERERPKTYAAPSFDPSKYQIMEKIGDGAGGTTVHRCLDVATQKEFAIKIVPRADYEATPTEVMLMTQWSARNAILPTHVVTQDSTTYMSMELATGGDMLERILREGPLCEAQAAQVLRKVAESLSDLHSTMGCCHRDVKPENVCIKSDDVTDVRLCDFEQARPLLKHGHVYTKEESKDSSRGSLDYMAPERFYGIAAGAEGDCWSLGVLAYTLLRAQLPFDACLSPLQRRHPILKADVWDGLSEPAISLISSLLNVDAGQRLDLQGVFAHEWLSANRVETLSPFSSVQPPCSVQAQIDQAHSQACRLAQLAQLNTGDEEMTMSCSA